MKDERMQSLLDAWFADRDETARDPSGDIASVMANVPRTRQQARWWPFPTLRRASQTPSATGTADYRPSSIPATNGHASTVIGRTQTMFSPVKSITAAALVFALGGVLLIAQPFAQQSSVPGAETGAEPAPPVAVTITVSEGTGLADEVCTDATPPECTWAVSEQWSASDDRLSGTATAQVTERTWGGTGWIFEAYAIEVVNDEGTWVGTGRYFGGDVDLYLFTLAGEGAYDGLTAAVTNHRAEDQDEEGMKGVIVEGGLPAFPETLG